MYKNLAQSLKSMTRTLPLLKVCLVLFSKILLVSKHTKNYNLGININTLLRANSLSICINDKIMIDVICRVFTKGSTKFVICFYISFIVITVLIEKNSAHVVPRQRM